MPISEQRDPKTRKNYLLAEGKVEGVYFNELKEPKTYSGPNGPWTPTHSVNIVVDGTRISLGLTEKESVRAKDVDDNYQDVVKGAEVSVVIEENGEYKGVKQYQGRTSGITVLEVAPPESNQSPGNTSYTAKPRDTSAIEAGHALKGAGLLVSRGLYEDVLEAAKAYHEVTARVKEWYRANSEGLDEYNIGNGSGNAVNTAAQYVESTDELFDESVRVLSEVLPELNKVIKGVAEEKKAAKTKATPKKAPAKKQEEREDPTPDDEDETDLPF